MPKNITTTARTRLCSLVAAFTLMGWAAPGFSQGVDAPGLAGGALVTLDLSLGYEITDRENADADRELRSDFVLGVSSETRNQRFNLAVGSSVIVESGTIRIDNSNGQFGYALFNRNTEASIDLSYAEVDIIDIDEDLDGDTALSTLGTRQTHAGTIRLQTGRAMRFGTDTILRYRQVDFVDINNPDLVAQIRHSAQTTLRFNIDRRIEARTFASWSETVSDEVLAVETDTAVSLGVGATFLIDRLWTGTVDLAWTEIESEAGGAVNVRNGTDLTVGLTRDMRNGTLSFSFSREIAEAANINRLSAARALELANGAAVSGSVGLVTFDDGDFQPSWAFTYDQEVLRGRTLSASFSQDAAVDNNDDEGFLRTSLNLTYRQELTRNSFWAVNGAATIIDTQIGTGEDVDRAALTVEYGHLLTRDWNLVARAGHSVAFEDGTRTNSTNTFSVNLERQFSFRP